MIALVTLSVVLVASLIVTRIATRILTLTGLAQETARFQARSALTGVGFTTSEAESVVNHPLRRRVVMALMLVGSAGVITAVATLMLSFVNTGGRQALVRGALLLAVLVGLLLLARSPVVDRFLTRLIERQLARWTDLDVRDYAALLHLGGEYTVLEVFVRPDGWLAGRTLDELALRDEGVRVLGIVRADGRYVGAPVGTSRLEAGDTLVAYGRGADVGRLSDRPAGPAGDEDRRRAVEAGGFAVPED